MPWNPSDSKAKTKNANTPAKQKQWAEVANSELNTTGDEARAIRAANAVVRDHPAGVRNPKKHWSGR